ncbi:heterokaryon incompatibility protein-domain-containing protein [Rhypophila decipiens]|uniref:Heterokaryon incompatibility protein-domain-containing protein n=1 Tax=Rhypophila decipiens TaxID=261697 RepID=A0AAN6Y4J2_9PEZI|nr:heterokaryon incompatibility protein-domain-containing protein [Rhypophila decipiens]
MDLDQRLNHESGFRYPTINPRTQIRLLRRLPFADSTSPCQHQYVFEITHVQDLFRISYNALSYTWGSASSRDDLDEIKVGGQSFWIRRNLHDFLVSWHRIVGDPKHGAQPFAESHANPFLAEEERLIFIDAICINQLGGEDNNERQAQVLLMREIYHRADGVISWLGIPPDDPTRDAVQALAAAVRTRRDFGSQAAIWTPAQREAHRYLSHSRYWSRVWVMQEILLARELVVCCGEFGFPLTLFAGRSSHCSAQTARYQTPAERVTPYRLRTAIRPVNTKISSRKDALAQGTVVLPMGEMISELRSQGSVAVWETLDYQSHLSDNLYDIMARYGHLECSDARDKLYGFLGLVKEKSRRAICVDYNKGADFAFYQGLKAGVTELVQEMEADLVLSRSDGSEKMRQGRDRVTRFYQDIRRAFGDALSAGETDRILQKVLDELQIEQWLAGIDSALLLRENGYGGEIVSWKDFRGLSSGGQDTARKGVEQGGWLHRWHTWQYKAVTRAKRRLFSKNRSYVD